jgi:hypothetical protein
MKKKEENKCKYIAVDISTVRYYITILRYRDKCGYIGLRYYTVLLLYIPAKKIAGVETEIICTRQWLSYN